MVWVRGRWGLRPAPTTPNAAGEGASYFRQGTIALSSLPPSVPTVLHRSRRLVAVAVTHLPSAFACLVERAFLRTLQGGCQVPIGVRTWYAGGDGAGGPAYTFGALGAAAGGASAASSSAVATLSMEGTVLSMDGGRRVAASVMHSVSWDAYAALQGSGGGGDPVAAWDALCVEAEVVGKRAAAKCIAGGAGEILDLRLAPTAGGGEAGADAGTVAGGAGGVAIVPVEGSGDRPPRPITYGEA